MIIRAARAKFGPVTQRYINGSFKDVKQTRETELDSSNEVKRGVALGLDGSHSSDYKVAYASDELLIIHTSDCSITHEQLRDQLKHIGIWKSNLIPIDIPRTNEDGEADWTVGFKTLPRDVNRLDRVQDNIEEASEGMCFRSKIDIEAHIPDLQRSLTTFNE